MVEQQLRPVGPWRVRALGVGTWAPGGDWDFDGKPAGWGPVDDAESVAALRAAYDGGVRFVDTADVYGCGHSERVVGRAVAPFRDDVVIATKVGLVFDEDTRTGAGTDLSADHIRHACEASLRRLGVDHVDILQIHPGDASVAQAEEAVGALDLEGRPCPEPLEVAGFVPLTLRGSLPDLDGVGGRDADDTVGVGDYEVAPRNAHIADRYGPAEFALAVRVLAGAADTDAFGEDRPAQVYQRPRVPDAAVDDEPGEPADDRRRGEDLPEVAVLEPAAGVHDQDLSGIRGVHGPVQPQVVPRRHPDRVRRGGQPHRLVERFDHRGQCTGPARRLVYRRRPEPGADPAGRAHDGSSRSWRSW
jgi:hypothetical protein